MKKKSRYKEKLSKKRRRIDSIDKKLLDVISLRLKIVRQICEIKKQLGMDVYQPKRISDLLKKRRSLAKKHNIDGDFAEALYKVIIEESMRIQKKARK